MIDTLRLSRRRWAQRDEARGEKAQNRRRTFARDDAAILDPDPLGLDLPLSVARRALASLRR